MNDHRAICEKLGNGFNPCHRSCHSGQHRANEVVGCFLPHHERKNLEEPTVYQSQFCGSRVKPFFYNIINHYSLCWKDTVSSSAVSSSMYWSPLNLFCRREQGAKCNNKAQATRHQRVLSEKNDELHDARKQEPPSPPKEVNVNNLKGQVIHSWTCLTFTPPDNNNTCYFASVISSA